MLAESLALQLRLCSSQAMPMERRGGPAEVNPLTGHTLYTRERIGVTTVWNGHPAEAGAHRATAAIGSLALTELTHAS